MKNVKILIALLISTALIYSCNPKGKSGSKKPEITKMSFEQLSKAIGNDNAFKAFDRASLTETDPASRGKKVKPGAELTVIEDLILTLVSGNDFTSTTSVNAQWFSYQVFVPGAGNDGAFATCNHYYNSAGSAPANEPCTISASGNVRTFTSDFNYIIHLSNVVFKP